MDSQLKDHSEASFYYDVIWQPVRFESREDAVLGVVKSGLYPMLCHWISAFCSSLKIRGGKGHILVDITKISVLWILQWPAVEDLIAFGHNLLLNSLAQHCCCVTPNKAFAGGLSKDCVLRVHDANQILSLNSQYSNNVKGSFSVSVTISQK